MEEEGFVTEIKKEGTLGMHNDIQGPSLALHLFCMIPPAPRETLVKLSLGESCTALLSSACNVLFSAREWTDQRVEY